MNILTTRLNKYGNNALVLAKNTKYGISAVTYANRTQAHKKEAELIAAGIPCFVKAGHPFYIQIEEKKEEASPLMVEGEGAPQYTMFDLPKDTQLALL